MREKKLNSNKNKGESAIKIRNKIYKENNKISSDKEQQKKGGKAVQGGVAPYSYKRGDTRSTFHLSFS